MPRPPNRKLPYEVFGFNTGAESNEEIRERIRLQRCPFIDAECVKFRKSEPEVKIGSCALGIKTDGGFQPVIICPERFRTSDVFNALEAEFFPSAERVYWVREVNLATIGSFDYVAIAAHSEIVISTNYICVEIQAAGTTGTPWGAIKHYRDNLSLDGAEPVTYGINWANEYIKTMMQQIYKKGSVISAWDRGRKIVIALQDIGMDYILKQGSGIRDHCENDPFQFRPFSMYIDANDQWALKPSEKKYSADLSGIVQSLSSTGEGNIPAEEEFLLQIAKKGARDGVLPFTIHENPHIKKDE